MWRMARAAASLIKQFPFVRGVMVSGELSKNLATGKCDVDFFVIAEPGRVWIARTLLILFKKIFLLNRKKYFCVNTFTAADALEFDEKNLYTAAEIAYLKPIYGAGICRDFAAANGWVKGFFPNFDPALIPEVRCAVSDTPSGLQRVLERLLGFLPLDRIDSALLQWMERVWARRYPGLDDEKRRHAFRSTKSESRTYPSDYQEHVLAWYEKQMNAFAGAIAELP